MFNMETNGFGVSQCRETSSYGQIGWQSFIQVFRSSTVHKIPVQLRAVHTYKSDKD